MTATTPTIGDLCREVENLLKHARMIRVGGTGRMDFSQAVRRTEAALTAFRTRPMCNDGDCPMADFPHDPHPASSGSEATS
ncbi:MAG TPA: hypothetical protein VFK52_00085 [Nocardioidaceae bacterium]|nr:hypothetical protein [Nocardioidaceae bacterium]